MKNGKRQRGIILSYENQILKLEIEKKKKGKSKQKIIEEIIIPKSEIKETKLKINFK